MFYAISKQPSQHCTFNTETPRLQDCSSCCCCKQKQLIQELNWNAGSMGRLAKLTSSPHRFSAATHKMRDTELCHLGSNTQWGNRLKDVNCLRSHLPTVTFAYSHSGLWPHLHTVTFAYIICELHRWWVKVINLRKWMCPRLLGRQVGLAMGIQNSMQRQRTNLFERQDKTNPSPLDKLRHGLLQWPPIRFLSCDWGSQTYSGKVN